MIKRNIIQIIISVTIAMLLILWLSERLVQMKFLQANQHQMQKYGLLTAQVERQVEQLSVNKETFVKELAFNLNLMPEIVSWQITDNQGAIVDSYARHDQPQSNTLFSKVLYFPVNSSGTQNASLVVNFDLSQLAQPPTIINATSLLMASVIAALLGFIIYRLLRWVIQLEDYSKLVLSSDGHRLISSQNPLHNIIGHTISQLMLNNRLLVKSKTELTNQIRRTTYIDEVTELGNHLFFKAELQVRLHNHDEIESGLVIILAFLQQPDIQPDQHKLQQVDIANSLKGIVEKIDNSIVARLKDSEFVLLLPNFTALKTDQFCNKLINKLSQQVYAKPESAHHFIDIGICTYQQGFDYYHVMAEADLALRNAQLQGANNWYVYGEPLSENRAKGNLKWKSFLRKILDQRKISLFYQKVHYFDSPDKQHQEILARIHDGDETLTADSFLAMAFRCGLSAEFDRQIVNAVINRILCEQVPQKVSNISVNLFVPSLLKQDFSEWLIAKISSYPELSQRLIFEVSENLLRKNIEAVSPVINQLSKLGIRWCIEHFASIGEDQRYLDKIKIDLVKIDRRIVNNIAESPAQQLLFNSIVVSLKFRQVALIAEGVEKLSDATFIEQTDIQGAQGHYYSHPLELDFDARIKLASS